MLSSRFLTPKSRFKESDVKLFYSMFSAYCLNVCTCVEFGGFALGVAVLCCGRFQFMGFYVGLRPK